MTFLQSGFIFRFAIPRSAAMAGLAILLGGPAATGLSAQGKQLFGKVTFPLGDVQVQVATTPDWTNAARNK